MLKQRREAALQLSTRLFETESAIDEAIEKMAELTGYMPVARKDANLSAIVGQDAMLKAGHTLAALIEARGCIVETHNKLADARDQIGLREMGMGRSGDKPPMVQGNLKNNAIVSLVDRAA